MNKRGQVTVFIIFGIFFGLFVFLVFYFLGDRIIKQSETNVVFDDSGVEPLKNYVEDCIDEKGNEAIDLILMQGGKINPSLYSLYEGNNVNYLCYAEGFTPCQNRAPFVDELFESEIKNYLIGELPSCINLNEIRNEGYSVQEGELNVNVDVKEYTLSVDVYYPVTISKGRTTITESRFNRVFDAPLGKFADVAEEVVENEVLFGTSFDQVAEVLDHEITVVPF